MFTHFLPARVKERLGFNGKHQSNEFKHMISEGDLDFTHICSVHKKVKPIGVNQFAEDVILKPLLEKEGFDLDNLSYALTPVKSVFVYTDFKKYLTKFIWEPNFDNINFSFDMLLMWKKEIPTNPLLMPVDQVLKFLDRGTSATFPLNLYYSTKGGVVDDEEFQKSFIKFVYHYINNNALPLWAARQKEELRAKEKIEEGKIRSFLIGTIYLLLLSHILNFDLDMMIAMNWEKLNIGVGMSIFHGDYDRKMRPLIEALTAFADASKYDSRMQYKLAEMEAKVNNVMYKEKFVKFSYLMGTWSKFMLELKIEDFDVDTHLLRSVVTYDSFHSYCVLPHGEIVLKERGQNSGDGRTTSRNTCVHKAMSFHTSLIAFDSHQMPVRKVYNKHRKYVKDDECGDDIIIPVLANKYVSCKKWSKCYKEHMDKMGWDTDLSPVTTIFKSEYLSTTPLEVKTPFGDKVVALVNEMKIISSLLCKTSQQTPARALEKVCAARMLVFWNRSTFLRVDNIAKELIKTYGSDLSNKDFQRSMRGYFNESEIIALQCGSFESKGDESSFSFFNEDLLPIINELLE